MLYLKDIVLVRDLKDFDETIVEQVLANTPTDEEIVKIVTKRSAQGTFSKRDFFWLGSEHMGAILPGIKQTLLTVPGIVMPEDEEDLHD